MKIATLLFSFLICFFSAVAQNQIIGKWLSEDKQAITEIYEQNGKFFGNINWLKKPTDENGEAYKDAANTDKSKRNQPIIGLVVLSDFSFQNNEWKGGIAYDPKSGKSFNCKLWLADNNKLKVKGYWGILNYTETWTKVN